MTESCVLLNDKKDTQKIVLSRQNIQTSQFELHEKTRLQYQTDQHSESHVILFFADFCFLLFFIRPSTLSIINIQ